MNIKKYIFSRIIIYYYFLNHILFFKFGLFRTSPPTLYVICQIASEINYRLMAHKFKITFYSKLFGPLKSIHFVYTFFVKVIIIVRQGLNKKLIRQI